MSDANKPNLGFHLENLEIGKAGTSTTSPRREMALKGVIVVKGFRQVACNSPLHMLNQVDYLCFSIVFAVISAI
jgi:hypothetical protein